MYIILQHNHIKRKGKSSDSVLWQSKPFYQHVYCIQLWIRPVLFLPNGDLRLICPVLNSPTLKLSFIILYIQFNLPSFKFALRSECEKGENKTGRNFPCIQYFILKCFICHLIQSFQQLKYERFCSTYIPLPIWRVPSLIPPADRQGWSWIWCATRSRLLLGPCPGSIPGPPSSSASSCWPLFGVCTIPLLVWKTVYLVCKIHISAAARNSKLNVVWLLELINIYGYKYTFCVK